MADEQRSEMNQEDLRAAMGGATGADSGLPAGQDRMQADGPAAGAAARQDGGAQESAYLGARTDQARPDPRGTGKHMMESAGAIGGGAVNATHDVLRGAIGASEDVGSGLIGGVTHLASDVVHGIRDVGFEVRDGATGLIGAVGDIGGTAVHTVAHLLVDVVGGVREVVGAAMGHGGNNQAPRRDVGPD